MILRNVHRKDIFFIRDGDVRELGMVYLRPNNYTVPVDWALTRRSYLRALCQ